MLSTMMDVQLTVTALMRYGASAYGDREVVTCTEDGSRRQSYAQTGTRAGRDGLTAALGPHPCWVPLAGQHSLRS